MKFITIEDIKKLNDNYYNKERYVYFEEVIEKINLIDGYDKINKTLEIGPYKAPLVVNGDILDYRDYSNAFPIEVGAVFEHDGSTTPYPFKDKEYDLVIACQVLEHLGESQRKVFKELSRISKRAIITLPYKWFKPCNKHHMIDKKVINYWTNGFQPSFEEIMDNRILLIYEFDSNGKVKYPQSLSFIFEKCFNSFKKKLKSIINP